MEQLVTDPHKVERLAEEHEDENWDFCNWIKLEYGFVQPASAASTIRSPVPLSLTSSKG
jgi:hypothetical protein